MNRAIGLLTLTATLAACGPVDDAAQSEAGSEDWLAQVAAEAAAAAPGTEWIEVEPPAYIYAEHAGAYRSDTIDIPLGADGGALEYKLAMKAGDAIAYSWTAEGLADPFLLLSEFHGHTERVGGAPGTLMFYRRAVGGEESGHLVAPFDGIHGWYLKNDSATPIVVELRVAGFYELIPDQAGVVQ
jgi:hypothetical protein